MQRPFRLLSLIEVHFLPKLKFKSVNKLLNDFLAENGLQSDIPSTRNGL